MDVADVPAEAWAAARERSAAAGAAWRRSAIVQAIARRFDAAAAADLPTARRRAEALLADDAWVGELLDPLIVALAADPRFEPPVRGHRSGGRVGAALVETPAARITATVLSARSSAAAPLVVVPGHLAVTRYVRSGGARLLRWRAEPIAADFDAQRAAPARAIAALAPADGEVAVHDGRTDGYVVTAARADVLMLTLSLTAGRAPLTREYRTRDGALTRVATTDDAGARSAMLLTLLRVSGRADAGAAFTAATHEPAFHLRWSAMREWLALDAGAALPRLAEMAVDDPHHDVREAASRTLALAQRKLAAACPA